MSDDAIALSSVEEPCCAHCGEMLDMGSLVSCALTSQNTALLFHSRCLAEMHERSFTIDSDERRALIRRVIQVMNSDN